MELSNHEQYVARFERIESVLESMVHSQKQLLTAQVLMTDEVAKLGAAQTKLAEAQTSLTESHKALAESHDALMKAQAKTELANQETQGKLDALIHMWDDWIRERRSKEDGGPAIQ